MLSKLRKWWDPFSEKIFRPLSFLPPNLITIFTPIFGAFAGYFIYLEKFKLASLFVFLSGFFDLLDGAIARASGRKTKFGAILDSTMDRLSEGLIYAGASFHYPLMSALALIFSYLVSYVRAKDDRIKVGVAERGDRIFLLIFFLYFEKLELALKIVTLLAFITTIQRLKMAREILKS